MKNKFSSILLMYISFFIYSLSSICSKFASKQNFLSWKYILFFFCIFVILGVYAVLWQQILKRVELSFAMANKPVVLVLQFIWASFIFKEEISLRIIIGMVFVFIGIVIISTEKTSVNLETELGEENE